MKEESPDLMPEDDEMLAALAAAVDTTCETIELGSEKPGRTDETDAMDVEEDTDE